MIVCYSQGNMIGFVVVFFGDWLFEVMDQWGKKGCCVVDIYVFVNFLYSFVEVNMIDLWVQCGVCDKNGYVGCEIYVVCKEMLRVYFDILCVWVEFEMFVEDFDCVMESVRLLKDGGKLYSVVKDWEVYGLYQKNIYGRVMLYCCLYDQVIFVLIVQGIGWCGMSIDEISVMNVWGVFL